MHVGALWLSCGTPAAPTRPGRRSSHTTTRELQTCTFERPGATNTTKIPRKRPKERAKRLKKTVAGEGTKKREILGPHPSGPHPSGPHFFWVWAPTLRAPTLRTPPPFGPPPFGPPPFGPPPFGPPPFGPPPFGPHPTGPHPSGPHPSGPHPSGPHWVCLHEKNQTIINPQKTIQKIQTMITKNPNN